MQYPHDIQRCTNPFKDDRPAPPSVEVKDLAKDSASSEPVHAELEGALEIERIEPRAARLLGHELRTMTGHEEEFVEEFSTRREHGEAGNAAVLCNELLARCLVAPGGDPGPARARIAALTVAERDLALIMLRRRSYGDEVDALIDCPACGEVNDTRFDLAQWPLELDPIPTRVRVRVGELGEAELRLPTAGDQAELLEAERGSNARRRSWMLARVLLDLRGQRGPFSMEQLHQLPVGLRRGLARGLAQCLPQVDLSLDVRCCACGHEFASPLDIESFFLPK